MQLRKNFLFTKVKLKLHGFHQVKIVNVLFQRKRHPIKKLFPKISQTSLECLLIGVLFDQVAGLELSVNFVKCFRTILCRTTVNGCFWTLRGIGEGKYSRK